MPWGEGQTQRPEFNPQNKILGVEGHVCNPSTRVAETEGSTELLVSQSRLITENHAIREVGTAPEDNG